MPAYSHTMKQLVVFVVLAALLATSDAFSSQISRLVPYRPISRAKLPGPPPQGQTRATGLRAISGSLQNGDGKNVATVVVTRDGQGGGEIVEAESVVQPDGGGIKDIKENSPIKSPWFFSKVSNLIKKQFLILSLLVKLATLKTQAFGRNLDNKIKSGPFGKSKVGKLTLRLFAVLFQKKVLAQLLLILGSYTILFQYLKANRPVVTELSYAGFLKLLEKHPDKINTLRLTGSTLSFLVAGKRFMARVVQTDSYLLSRLVTSGVDFASAPPKANVLGVLWTCAYALFLWTVTTRMMQGPQDEGAGRRRDKTNFGSLSFADVAGQERAKLEVREVCEMLRAPERYTKVGARVPAGVLLVGPPGTGKTLLARVAAAEAGVPFYACSATDFVEVFVGRGPARVRKLFKTAAENAPCIVFVDEIDSIGRSRRMGSLNSEQENTLNQLLTSMDGLDTSNNGVVVMAATNRFELLDPALLRAGRFDRIVQCPLPDKEGRKAILGVHAKSLKLERDVDLERIARSTPGTCGADLAAIVNEAAIRTARRGASTVSEDDLEDAVRGFYAGRGISMSGLAESMLPAWLKGDKSTTGPQPQSF